MTAPIALTGDNRFAGGATDDGALVERVRAQDASVADDSVDISGIWQAQVDPNGAVRADDFVGADTCVGRYIAAGIGNSNVAGVVTDRMVSSFDRGGNQSFRKEIAGGGGWRV